MFCTQCGKRNSPDARFCFACGVPTVAGEPQASRAVASTFVTSPPTNDTKHRVDANGEQQRATRPTDRPGGTPKAKWWRRRFWPVIDDESSATDAVKAASSTAIFLAAVTAVLAMIAIQIGPFGGISRWSLIDVALLTVVGWRLRSFSKPWAVAGVCLAALGMALTVANGSAPGAGSIIYFLAFINGMRATFGYARFRRAVSGEQLHAAGVPAYEPSNGTNFGQNQPSWNNAAAALIIFGGIVVLIVLAVVATNYDRAAAIHPAMVAGPALGDATTEKGQRASRRAKAERAKHLKAAPRADPIALFNAVGRKDDPVYVAEQSNLDDNDVAKQAFLRGQIASNEGRHAQAAKFFERVLTIKQDNGMAHYGAALAYAELGNKARAEHHFSWFLLFASPDDGRQVRDAKAWLARFTAQ